MSGHIVLRTYPDRLHAELASSFLDSEGIRVVCLQPVAVAGELHDCGMGRWHHPARAKGGEGGPERSGRRVGGDGERRERYCWADDDDVSPAQDADAPATSDESIVRATPAAMLEGICTNCGGPADCDDTSFTRLRRFALAIFGLYFLGPLFWGTIDAFIFDLLAVAGSLALFAFLIVRARFLGF